MRTFAHEKRQHTGGTARLRRSYSERMAFQILLSKALTTVVTGAVGVAAYNGARTLIAKAPIRGAAVTATEWGLRGVRKAEEGAESARLQVSDVVAEAKERLGEEVSPPAVGETGHGHSH